MKIPVVFSGSIRRWRYLDSGRFSDWLESNPWREQKPVVALHHHPLYREELVCALQGEVRRVINPDESVHLAELPEDSCKSGPKDALIRWMGLQTGSLRSLAEALAEACDNARHILLMSIPRGSLAADWMNELLQIVDIHSKLSNPAQVVFIVLVSTERPVADSIRMDYAWPVGSFLDDSEETQWADYLHERLAWHCAGNLENVFHILPNSPSISVGDDSSLEDFLDASAKLLLEQLAPDIQKSLQIEYSAKRLDSKLLLPTGVFGPEIRYYRPAPWLARALLLENPGHPSRRYFESICLCRPLADRLFGLSMDLEKSVRDRFLSSPNRGPCSPETQAHLDRLKFDTNDVEHQINPRGRFTVTDPWDLERLSLIIQNKMTYMSDKDRNIANKLRYIRNALAHGTPVGWQTFYILESLGQQLEI